MPVTTERIYYANAYSPLTFRVCNLSDVNNGYGYALGNYWSPNRKE